MIFDSPRERYSDRLRDKIPLNRHLFRQLPRFSSYSSNKIQVTALDHSLRRAILVQFKQDEFLRAVLEDETTLLCAALNCIAGEWIELNAALHAQSSISGTNERLWEENTHFWSTVGYISTCQQYLVMVRETLEALKSPFFNKSMDGSKKQATLITEKLGRDYSQILRETESNLASLRQLASTIAAIRSITESEKAIERADSMG